MAHIDRRRFDAAQAAQDEAQDEAQAVLERAGPAVDGLERARVVTSRANLAVNRRSPDALPHSIAAYEALRDHFAPRRTIDVLSADARVGLALSMAGRRREAVDRLEGVAAELRTVAGPSHRITRASMNYLGNARLAVGDGAGARAVFLDLVSPSAATDPTVNDAMGKFNLALATWLQRDAGAAADHAAAAAAIEQRVLGPSAPLARQGAALHALLAAHAGRFDVAEAGLHTLAAQSDRPAPVVLFEGVIARAVARLRARAEAAEADETMLAAAVASGQSFALRVLAMLEAGPGLVDRPGAAGTWLPRVQALRAEVEGAHDRGSNDTVELLALEASVLMAADRPTDALDRLARARTMAATVGSPPRMRARLDADLADPMVAAGSHATAVAGHGKPAALLAGARAVLAASPLPDDLRRLQRAEGVVAGAAAAAPARAGR